MHKWLFTIAVALTVILFNQPSDANASTETVNVSYEGTDYGASDGFKYSEQSSRTATFSIPAKTGFIIKNVQWEWLDGKSIRVAAGDWVGKKSYIGTDTINGTSVNVKTIDTESYGGVFYWNRSGGTSLWKAVMSNGNNVNSSGCPSAPSDSWGYKMYPNCNTLNFGDDALSLVLKKKGGYYIDGARENPLINDDAVDLDTIEPAGVYPDLSTDVKNEIYGGTGKADPSTHYLDKYDVISKTSIRAYFNQVHDCTINGVPNNPDEPVCKYKDFANPGAKQMWWYSALKFQLQATTYRYMDKRLVVEWMPEENEITEIKVRHMVRLGPTGTYTQAVQTTTTLSDPLPLSRTISADSSYGTVKGRNVNYSSFSNSILNGTQVTVNLSSTQKTAYVTFFYEKPAPQFTGDFDIVPSVIDYRDSFSLVPKDFVMNGCAYQSHQYKIERNGTYTTSAIKGMDKSTTYTRSNYPWLIGVGDHTVSIKIKTSCGESDWMGQKTLTVTDMGDNQPPQFKVGFVNPYNRSELLTEVVEGTTLDLVYIDDPSVPTPTDPDGDLIYFMGFDTDGSSQDFVRAIPSNSQEYTDGFHGIVMDTLGYFSVSAQMRDEFGLTANASTYIHVVPKNPVPIAKCTPFATSNHPVTASEFDASHSYSPINRSIDHTKDEWQNKLTSYVNETMSNLIETVKLDVYDSAGLKSVEPGVCSIVVKPDLPPVAKLEVPAVGIRNQPIDVINHSYSPDGDQIESVEYKYKYDADNNGFENDDWKTISGSVLKLTFTPNKVGKYLFYTKVTEDYGKWDDTLDQDEALLMLDVVNDSPTISFDLEGKNEQPDLEPMDSYLPADILEDWKLYQVNSNTLMSLKNIKWFNNGNVLAGSTGKGMENQRFMSESNSQTSYSWLLPFSNLGFGNNSLSPYRSISNVDSSKTQLLLDMTKTPTNRYIESFGKALYVRTNESMFYVGGISQGDSYKGVELFAFNKSKIGGFSNKIVYDDYYNPSMAPFYPDGDPVDFSLTPKRLYNEKKPFPYYYYPTYQDYQAKTNGVLKGQGYYSGSEIIGYEVTDRTIYMKVRWTKSSGSVDTYYQYGEMHMAGDQVYDLRSYDAFTGDFIASTAENGDFYGYTTASYAKGDHIMIQNGNTYTEWNRNGQLIATYTMPNLGITLPDDSYELRKKYQEMILGDIYIISEQGWKTASNQADGTYLSKINGDDFTLAWTTKLQGGMATTRNSYGYQVGAVREGFPNLVVNPIKQEILVNTFTSNGFGVTQHYQRIKMSNGSPTIWDTGLGDWNSSTTSFQMDWFGNYMKLNRSTSIPLTQSAEGWTSGPMDEYIYFHNKTGVEKTKSQPENILVNINRSFSSQTSKTQGGMYVGDGMYLSFNGKKGYMYDDASSYIPVLTVGTPTTDPLIYDAFTLGQFKSESKLENAELAFKMTLHQPKANTDLAGMSFRMQNPLNRYAVETDGVKLYLSKYRGGSRTVLASQSFPMQPSQPYSFRILMQNEAIQVYMDGVPYFEVSDNEYNEGYFGMFADRGLVDFANIGSKPLKEAEAWDTQYAIWNEDDAAAAIRMDNVIFEDPEDDPAAELAWELHHTPRFLNNQGLSVLDGETITAGTIQLDNVGDYVIALKGRDDPNLTYKFPDMTFDDYRKDSNEFTRKITVHRRPIADFDVAQQSSDGKVIWTDHSRDPDRFASSTNYSKEDTGIDYKATRGIMEKRFYYTTPSGTYVPEKLVAPQETGTYEIGMAVKDEYGAWSEYHVEYLTIGKIAAPNTPPTPGFTTSKTSTYRGASITINSNASDVEDGNRTHLPHTYYVKNATTNSAETIKSTSRTSWSTSFDTLGTYTIRQLVEDSEGASAQIEHQIDIVNRKPSANVTVPSSTNQNSPTKLKVLRPEFQWTYSDSDGDTEAMYQVRIYKYGGILLLDSGSQTGNALAWTASADLPEHVNMYVRVRVFDGYDWGEWSAAKYFYIETNRPPTVDFTWSPQPVYEGDTVAFQLSIADPDRDALHAVFEMKSPAGATTSYEYDSSYPYAVNGPSLPLLQTGNWQVKLTVDDGKAPPVSVQKTVQVKPLSVSGAVHHTEQWNELRQSYNRNRSGNEEFPRGYAVFWAGEKFLLEGFTTDTGTTVQATKVTVQFGEYKTELTASDDSSLHWTGELWDESFEQMENGPATFLFTAAYNNGTVKEDEASVEVMGDVNQLVGVHRVK